MRAFISHIAEEAPLASVLKDWIESAFLDQVEVFVSSEDDDVTAGDQWFRRIGEALTDAKVLLIICSPNSVHRSWINFEAGAGWIKKVSVIPICHSGMTKETLPIPLSFFQALNVGDTDFAQRVVAALARHLGFKREPRIPYQEMTAEVQDALLQIAEQSGHLAVEEGMGFLDHLVAMQERFGELSSLISAFGEHTTAASVEISKFNDQANKAQANRSEGTDRYLQKIAKKFGDKMGEYAKQIEGMNQDYEAVLPDTERSLQFVISFSTPETEDDWEAIEIFFKALDGAEAGISFFRNTALSTRKIMSELPNYQRQMRKAIREIVEQYDILVTNLDETLEMMQQARAVMKSYQ